MDFWRAVAVLGKRKWLILMSVVATTGLAFVGSQLVGSRWQATVTFTTPANSSLTVAPDGPLGASAQPGDPRPERAQLAVFAALVKSRDVIEPALTKIHADQIPQDLLKNISLEAEGPHMFAIQYVDPSPSRASEFANALADSFVEKNRAVYTQQARKVVELLSTSLREADGKLSSARLRYDRYRRQHQVTASLNDTLAPALDRLQSARKKRDEISDSLVQARSELQQKERELSVLPATVPLNRPGTLSPLAQQLETQLAQAKTQLTTLRARYTEDHIEVRRARAVAEALDADLKAELAKRPDAVIQQPNPEVGAIQRTARELRQRIGALTAEASAIDGAVGKAQAEVNTFSNIDSPLGALSAEVSQLTEARSNLAARLQAAGMALDVAEGQHPVAIVDRVSAYNPPINTTKGRTEKLLLIAMLCALLGTSGLVIGLDSIDQRLRSLGDAERALPVPVVAAIPQPVGMVTAGGLPRVTELQPASVHSEAYRFLGLRLLSDRTGRIRSLMVISAKGGQGSTGTIANLGITLAQAGRSVVLVDANIRSPHLDQVFGLPNNTGFTSLLEDPNLPLDEVICETSVPGLRVISSGPAPENPWSLFRSSSLIELDRRLRRDVDFILYDTPSAVAFTDALNLAPVVDAAFLCVRAMEPTSGSEQSLVDFLTECNIPILGSVISDVPAPVLPSYQHYQRYYPVGANNGHAEAVGIVSPVALQLPNGEAPNGHINGNGHVNGIGHVHGNGQTRGYINGNGNGNANGLNAFIDGSGDHSSGSDAK